MLQARRHRRGFVRGVLPLAVGTLLLPLLPASAAAAVHTGAVSSLVPATLVRATGTRLMLDGRAWRFVGLNAYELATDWGVNAGCGGMLSDSQLDAFFASLPPDSLVRFWAYQGSMATDVHTHQLEWGPIDRVVRAAVAHHQRLIFSLTGQGGTCDGEHWQDPSWYGGGFRQVFDSPSNSDGRGLNPLSYWDYLRAIVTRYRDSPAVGMWEPVSEAEASSCPAAYEPTNCSGHQTCPDEAVAAGALRHFFDTVGREIHRLDPSHLVESGLLGGGQCGTEGPDFAYVSASPGLDVLSYHDYTAAGTALGGDRWNGVAVRLAEARQLRKPIILGEIGLEGASSTRGGCPSLSERAADVARKLRAAFAHGSSGALIWNWVAAESTTSCSYDVVPGDPLLATLKALSPA